MRRNYIVRQGIFSRIMIPAVAALLFFTNCGEREHHHQDILYAGADSVLLQPSGRQAISNTPLIKAEFGTKVYEEEIPGIAGYDTRNLSSISSRVRGRIERLLIRYNYQPIKKGQLIMEIYSPELAAAQQELLFLQNSGDVSMTGRAKQRLLLLGMRSDDVERVLRTGKISYRVPVYSPADGYIVEKQATQTAAPGSMITTAIQRNAEPLNLPSLLREGQNVSAGQTLYVIYNAGRLAAEFSLTAMQASMLKNGDELSVYRTGDKNTIAKGRIAAILPVLRAGERFTIARAYLDGFVFRVGDMLTARIPLIIENSWWLPVQAIVSSGNKSLVFKREGDILVPAEIQTGLRIEGLIQVREDISDWEVAKNSSYLIDSESFIKK